MAQADKILIGFYLNAREVGIYAVAAALVVFVPVILQSVNQIFSPIISALHGNGEYELLGRIFQTSTKWIFGLTVPLVALMIVFAHPIMSVFGHDFETGWAILIIGALGQLINCATGSVGYLLLMSGNERRLVRIQVVMGIVVVASNVVLIPLWGITGAAVAAALTNAVSNLWYLRTVRRVLKLSPYNVTYLRLSLPVMGTVAVLYLLRLASGHLANVWLLLGSALCVGYIVFVGMALILGLDPDDRLIADAIHSRLRDFLPRTEANASAG
jgi:O-antigen/teichoic acid export membrane protein